MLGSVAGEVAAPSLGALSGGERVLTALTIWPEYLRLLLFPASLAADYSPALILPATSVSADVVLGAAILVGLVALTWSTRSRLSLVSLGTAWFLVAILPVSNLLFSAGVMLAERTLYLPSVGLSMVVTGLVAAWPPRASLAARRGALALGVVALTLLTARTITRNPTWMSTFTVLNTLALEHPQSYLALRARAEGLAIAGDADGARRAYQAAVELVPAHYAVLVEAGSFHGRVGEYDRAAGLLTQAAEVAPEFPEAHALLAAQLMLGERFSEGHAVALRGLAQAGPDARLYALVSESYIARGDLEAALRARLAALGQAPDSRSDWTRLAELYEALGRAQDAAQARERASAIS